MAPDFEDYSNIQIGNETFDYGGGLFDVGGKNPIELVINFLSNANMTAVTGSLEKLLSESYKFIRLADDINDMKNYINDMRLCFVALTISGYVAMLIYAIVLFCGRRNGRNAQRRRHASGMAYMDEESLGWDRVHENLCIRLAVRVNGPFETSPLNVTETTTSLEAPGAETAH
ncbi:Protease HtpX [Trichinella spiralis]|uniref:Protease HtpX n=1 Tax=Trichinella spiralis TaxID=6334 RepID=A0ABR3L0V7_TRISP